MQQRRRVAKWRLRLSNCPIVRSFHSVYGRVPQNYDGCGCRISFGLRLVSVSVSVSVAAFDRSTRADSFVLLSPVAVAVVVVLLLVVAVVFYCSCCCCCCCHWAMLSIIDDAALAFEFLCLPLFLLTAFFWLWQWRFLDRIGSTLFSTYRGYIQAYIRHSYTHTHYVRFVCASANFDLFDRLGYCLYSRFMADDSQVGQLDRHSYSSQLHCVDLQFNSTDETHKQAQFKYWLLECLL